MPDLDALKMNKIKEFAEKAELTGKPASAIKQNAAAAKPKDAGKPAKAKVVKPEAKEEKAKVIIVISIEITGYKILFYSF